MKYKKVIRWKDNQGKVCFRESPKSFYVKDNYWGTMFVMWLQSIFLTISIPLIIVMYRVTEMNKEVYYGKILEGKGK